MGVSNDSDISKGVSEINLNNKSRGIAETKLSKKYDVPVAFIVSSYFDAVTKNVNRRPMPWEGFFNAGLITEEEMQTFRSLQQSKRNFKDYPVESTKCTQLILGLLVKLHRIEVIQYLLVLLNELIDTQETSIQECLAYSSDRYSSVYSLLEKNFESHDDYIGLMACKIIIKLLNVQNSPDFTFDFRNMFAYFESKLDSEDPSVVDVVIQLVQSLLAINGSRQYLFTNSPGCLEKMVHILKDTILLSTQQVIKVSVAQTQYDIGYILWLLTFDQDISSSINKRYDIIPSIIKIARSTLKEKVIRIMIFTLKNLFSKAIDVNLPSMIVSGAQSCLTALNGRKIQDPDLAEEINDLLQKLNEKLEKETTWDEYMNELSSGMLSWTQVHTSDAFWKMNINKFNQEDHLAIKLLSLVISDANGDPLAISVACHDLGQYIKYYPSGKAVLTNLGAKARLMQLMTHSDDKVRYEALTSVQEFMVNAWKNHQVDPIF
ncbi:V-type proton ATPase subunit H [Smittium mucronatum]|uniref:V-type proton ATPase subunit H n=1 Tax=Smittium mucronatum TaxID=133383 RepID=A0A1R0H8F9_9FUNG|nr:V-type proton ATPase subunit H [Smittium mucronatum]